MMQEDFITASAHIAEIDPEFSDLPIVRERIDNAGLNCFITNSFGFGGTNACLAINRYS